MWIGEAAEAAGVNVETVRYYERRGLLEQPRRPAEGYRDYSNETVQIVRFIKQAQDLGFTLEEIDELVRLSGTTLRGRERARAAAERKLKDLECKTVRLRDMQGTLRRLIAACRTENTPECPILEALRSGDRAEQPVDGSSATVHETATTSPTKTRSSKQHQRRSAT
ncbi:MAG: MerR family transcriptional regulator [Vicinamibacterales bacterium]